MKKHFQRVVKQFRDGLPAITKEIWIYNGTDYEKQTTECRPEYPKAMAMASQMKKRQISVNFGWHAKADKIKEFIDFEPFKTFCAEYNVTIKEIAVLDRYETKAIILTF